MCPMQYMIEYVLGHKSPSNKKADKGTICHKVFEILAWIKLSSQQGRPYFYDDVIGQVDVYNYDLDNIKKLVYQHYTSQFTHHEWTNKDSEECNKWVDKALIHNNGMFDPRNREILQPEQHFDIEIKKDWAKYSWDTKQGKLEGYLAIKGTIDLITQIDSNTIEVIDWKTGRRLDWATGQEKTLEKLHNDPQLMIYFYAVHKLYPNIDNIIVSINFINDGGPFSVCFDKSRLYDVEMMLRNKFETIKNTKIPTQNKTWKCNKLCHFGKTTFENTTHLPIIEYRDNQVTPKDQFMTKCEQIYHDFQVKGVETVVDEYTRPGYTVGQYKAPGSVE